MKRIAIRADASESIGVGHIMRCLTLANFIKNEKHFTHLSITFICNSLPSYLQKKIESEGFNLIELANNKNNKNNKKETYQTFDAQLCIDTIQDLGKYDLLIQDHYQLSAPWQKRLKSYYHKILVIEDIAERVHQSDFLLDQTFGRQPQEYGLYVNSSCQLLTGQSYILLREEFTQLIPDAKAKRAKNTKINNILISFGGTDVKNMTGLAIESIIELSANERLGRQYSLSVVLSSTSKQLNVIKNIVRSYSWITLFIDTNEMAQLMLNADLAIGANGSTAWERCSLGLPTISFDFADNQKVISQKLNELGAIINLGTPCIKSKENIQNQILNLCANHSVYTYMVKKCFNVCDGYGTSRVLKRLASILQS